MKIGRWSVGSALVMFVWLWATASASALGNPLPIGTVAAGVPGFGDYEASPSMAVDAAGTAYIAWEAPTATSNAVQYCVLPDGASACSASGSLTPAGDPGPDNYVQPRVLIDGGIVTIIVVNGSPGGPATAASADEPLQEWQAADGTASFTPVNGGESPALTGGVPEGAVDVPGTNELGLLWIGGTAPTFSAYPLQNPPECSDAKSSGCTFATLEPSSNPDQIGPFSGESVAAGAGPNPGILSVFPTNVATGPLGCPDELGGDNDGTAFAYGSGLESATNDYNVSPGSPNSAWQVPVTQLTCQHFIGAATGGAGGFGVLMSPVSLPMTSHSTVSVAYLPFDQSTLSFDKPQATVVPAPSFASEPSVSQDGSGDMYATYELEETDAGDGPLALSYSTDGGATWQGPAPLDPTLQSYVQSMTSAVGSDGVGWAAFIDDSTIEAVQFDAADAATSLSAAVQAPSTSSTSVTLPVRCAVVPCTVSTSLTTAVPTSAARGASVTRSIQLGSGELMIKKSGVRKLVVHLTAAGRRLLKAAKRHLKVKLSEGTQLGTYTAKRTANLTLAVPAKRR